MIIRSSTELFGQAASPSLNPSKQLYNQNAIMFRSKIL